MLEGLDQSVGRLVDFLEDPNGDGDLSDSIASNTLVLFYGDNGGQSQVTSNSPLRSGKGSNYEGGVRVPLVAWMPGTVAAGSASNEPIQAVDFYPTFAELAGATLPDAATQPLDGESLVGLLDGVVDAADYTVWRDHLSIASTSESHSVPEPSTAWLLGAGITVGAIAARRRVH